MTDKAFKWRHFEPQIILLCVRWYCSYSLSYRNLVEMMEERGLSIYHTTIMRWVHQYAVELNNRLRPHLRVSTRSWNVDEVMIRIRGSWMYLYRAVDSDGKTLDFMVSPTRKKAAARKFFRKILGQHHNKKPLELNVDGHASYPPAFNSMKSKKYFTNRARLRKSKYNNNYLEQDHRAVKRVFISGLGFQALETASKTIAGIEAIHMIRKGQTRRRISGGLERAKFVNELFKLVS